LRKKAVFFDLGGTLLVMRRDRIFRRVLQEEGYDLKLDAIHAAYISAEPWWLSFYSDRVMSPTETSEAYRTLDEKVFSALTSHPSHAEALRVSRQVRKRWPELAGEIPLELYPDAEPTLRRLKKDGYTLGLVSNAPSDTRQAVEALGLPEYLGTIVISGAVGFSKPNPEIFRIALKEAGASAEEAVHVGDLYESDIVGARNAGITGLLIDRDGVDHHLDCPRLKSLSEVYPYLT
jgi:putative hydrolase of the HAD superfamily